MQHVDDGQCGLCTHFGELHPYEEKLVMIRKTHEAPETFVGISAATRGTRRSISCVTPISGCEGFEPAEVA